MFRHFDTIPACNGQTDRQAYGQTSSDSIVRAVHSVARGVKMQRVMDGPSTDIFSLYVK